MSGILAKLNTSTTRSTTTQKSSIARSASQKLSTSKAATGNSGVRTDYGIFAQRSVTGSGAHYNVKGYNSASLHAYRHSVNDNHTQLYNNMFNYWGDKEGTNSINKFMAATMAMGMLAELSAGIVDAVKSSKTSKTTPTTGGNNPTTGATGATSSTTTSTSTSISKMKQAKDSGSLREAIEAGKADVNKMRDEKTELAAKLPDLEKASKEATTKIATLEPQIKEQEEVVNAKQSLYDQAKTVLSGAEQDKTSKLNIAKQMETAVGQAATNYTNSVVTLENAKADLAKQSPTNEDGSPNPKYQIAQHAVEVAEQAVKQNKDALDNAKKEHKNAVDNYNNAIEAYQTASKAVTDAKGELEKARAELDKSNEELGNLKKQKSEQEAKVKEYNDAKNKITELDNSINECNLEINIQNDRLKELEESEKNDLASTNTKMDNLAKTIQKRNGKIDTSDGLSFLEKQRQKKNEKNAKTYSDLTSSRDALQSQVNYTALYKKQPTERVGGKEFRTGSYNGETLYMIGAKRVDEKTYNAELEKAKKSDNP